MMTAQSTSFFDSPNPLSSDPLDGFWRVRVAGAVYGPYTGRQMQDYAGEGRITAESEVMPDGATHWRRAAQDEVLGRLFSSAPSQSSAPSTPAKPRSQAHAEADPASANFVVIADLRARNSSDFDTAVLELGRAYKLSNTVWLVHAAQTAGALRNHLVQYVGQSDTLFVIDTTRDKSAWFNYGPEVDAKIRAVMKG